MGTGAPVTLRTPLILLALTNLAFLGMRLWPWPEVMNLPLNGATGIDPAVCLVAYAGLIFWIATTKDLAVKSALQAGSMLGLLAGAVLFAQVMFKTQPSAAEVPHSAVIRVGLLLAAGLIWGIAGLQGSKAGGSAGLGILAGLWSAMVSCLMACSAVLVQMSLATGPVPVSNDPWKQYEGLAIGNAATQSLVNSLNAATWFLLVGPIAGGVLGLFFGLFGQSEKN